MNISFSTFDIMEAVRFYDSKNRHLEFYGTKNSRSLFDYGAMGQQGVAHAMGTCFSIYISIGNEK